MTAHDDMHIVAAAHRQPVVCTLDDGTSRTARLVYWPNPTRHRNGGGRARIQLPSGAYLSVPTHTINLSAPTGETT